MNILSEPDRANPGFLIRRLHQRSVSIFLNELTELGITPIQYTILRHVLENPGIDQVKIASLAGLDTSTTTDVLTRLDRRGLIVRVKDQRDQRKRLASLTADGAELLGRARPLVESAQHQLLSPLNKQQQKAFMTALCLLIERHEQEGDPPLGKMPWRRSRR